MDSRNDKARYSEKNNMSRNQATNPGRNSDINSKQENSQGTIIIR